MSTPTYVKGLDVEGSVMDSGCTPTAEQPREPTQYVLYWRRWVVLGLFVFYSASNSMQWIQYTTIEDVIVEYYGVSSILISWTSMIYMVTYIPLIFPASWLLDRVGLRVTTIIGAVGTCTGSWIKVFSVPQDMFWLGFLGQTVVAISQIFILNVPPRLAALWFGPNQVSSACSVGVFGNQLGAALGFLLPPILVPKSADMFQVGKDLQIMFYIVAGFTSILLVLILLFFQAAPPTPPSAAQDLEHKSSTAEFLQSIKRLFLNRNYVLLLISYGINVGVFYAISTLLNQVVLAHFTGANADVGRIGLVMILSGMAGSVLCGVILDKTHRFKETTLTVYAASVVGMVIFTFTLDTHLSVVYMTSIILGFFMTGYLPVGFEFASEITYPEPEGTTSGILNAVVQVFGILLTMLYSELIRSTTERWANIALCVLLVLGTAITACIGSDLRRQAAHAKS